MLIAGFGRFGQIVARLLFAQKIPFIAIDPDSEQVDLMRRFGNQIYYGDPTKAELLRSAGAANVEVFVIAIDDVDASLRAARLIRRHYPEAQVFVRARDRRHAWRLMDLGVRVIRETFLSSLEMGREVLVALGMSEALADERARRFRDHDQRVLEMQHLVYDDEDALRQTVAQSREELAQLFEADEGEGTREAPRAQEPVSEREA